jgi:hypothetical protein
VRLTIVNRGTRRHALEINRRQGGAEMDRVFYNYGHSG